MFNTTSVFTSGSELFVGVPGVVIGGWVGFGVFIAVSVLLVALTFVKWIPRVGALYPLLGYSAGMVVVYLLAATEQFVMQRDKDDDVNLLMVFVNSAVWVWLVPGTGRMTRSRPIPIIETYSLWVGIASQTLFVLSAFVWNGAVYALWALALLLMFASILHYAPSLVADWTRLDRYSRAWLAWSVGYTVVYVFAAFLSHLYLAVLSLSGAVWVYLVMHLAGMAWLTAAYRQGRAMDAGAVRPHTTQTEISFNSLESGAVSEQ